MTAEVSKFVAYGLTGKPTGVNISKFVGYVLLQPGSEDGGGSATPAQAFSYGHILTKPNPVGAT